MKIMKDYVTREERIGALVRIEDRISDIKPNKPWWAGLFKDNARLMCIAGMLIVIVYTLIAYKTGGGNYAQ